MVNNEENRKVAYLMRHGSYEQSGGLSVMGKQGVRRAAINIGDELLEQGYKGLVRIFASPLLRAEETADMVALTLENKGIETNCQLENMLECDKYQIMKAVNGLDYDVGIFVSHQPDLERALRGERFLTASYRRINVEK
ncbi:MAG: hypothetical protein KC589_11215 [Nanoarchaeota archaeon]|nr:hypothetical protein [Nanoarchaeota archaeon]